MRVSTMQRQQLKYVIVILSLPVTLIVHLVTQNDLETHAKELSAAESEISDKRVRLEAERAIEFYDELGSDAVCPCKLSLFYVRSNIFRVVCKRCSSNNEAVPL